MRKSILYIFAMLFLSSLFSCNMNIIGDKDENDSDSVDVDSGNLEKLDLFEETVIPEAADEFFDDFLYSYISSDDFRTERTPKKLTAPELSTDEAFVVIYERDEDLELQKDSSLNKVLLERIDWNEENMTTYDFTRKSGKWHLDSEKETEISESPNAAFFVFFKDFLTDTLYQHESIKVPLSYKYYSEDDGEVIESSLTISDWSELLRSLPDLSNYILNIDYGQSYISNNRKSVMMKGLSNGLSMKFHFDYSNGKWKLIQVES